MSNAVFPTLEGEGWGRTVEPEFNTTIKKSKSGKEKAKINWSYPIWHFAVEYDYIIEEPEVQQDLEELVGFFLERYGAGDSFLYRDPEHNSVVGQNFGIGTGADTKYQLVRAYKNFIEPVRGINGDPLIYINGVLKTKTADYTVDDWGMVTFTSPPAEGAILSATFNYYFRVRFKTDNMPASQMAEHIWEVKKVEFQTLK